MIKVLRFAALFDHFVGKWAQYRLHHGQMFAIVVRLKKGHTLEELVDDAAEGPDVARLRPAELEDNFRRAVVASRHHGRVMLMVERGRSEVDQPDGRIEDLEAAGENGTQRFRDAENNEDNTA